MTESHIKILESLDDNICNYLADLMTQKIVQVVKDFQRLQILEYISKHPEQLETTLEDYIICLFSHSVGQAYIRLSKKGLKCVWGMIGKAIKGEPLLSAVDEISEKELQVATQFMSFQLWKLICELQDTCIISDKQASNYLIKYIKTHHNGYALIPVHLGEADKLKSVYRTLKTTSKDTLNNIFYRKYKGYAYLEKPFKGDCYRYLINNLDNYSFSI
ncbi:hypothetical protein [Bacteroides uniformis]|uniref:hypothetical protein n=1 Tax=Bacteroides uniformis TaxID=820 RepID=UPI00189BB1D4|nr:hypothetical protein [Bacteroides uniformis]MDC1998123.1 hypothetical protein [Bacteroides uniformis]MDC2001887.1 hypothetical protein [Bacteroides uniformis]MDC2005642.1 hypothetical protein [Bacteroides uniformis]